MTNQTPAPESVDLMGVRADGTTEVLGTTSMPPQMKMREIVNDYFGPPQLDDDMACDDATLCYCALDTFLQWLIAQGWQAPTAQFEFRPQQH